MRVSRRVHKDKWKQMAGLVEAPTPRPGTPPPHFYYEIVPEWLYACYDAG